MSTISLHQTTTRQHQGTSALRSETARTGAQDTITLKYAAWKVAPVLSVAGMVLWASTALAQSAADVRICPRHSADRDGASGKDRHRSPANRVTRLA
jgi:hypothetical protein